MTKPYPFQLEGVERMEAFNGRALLGDELGLGKTITALWYAKKHTELRPVIIVCPAVLKINWQREASRMGMHSIILDGIKPRTDSKFLVSPIIIINYDILHYWVDILRELKPQLIIFDEAHFLRYQLLKQYPTRRTKAGQLLAKNVPSILALTATPLTSRPYDLWPIVHMLRPDKFHSLLRYGMKYCELKKAYGLWDYKGASNLKTLHRRLRKYMLIRRLKKNVLSELPPLRRIVVPIEITDRRQYEQAENDLRGWVKDHTGKALKTSKKAEGLVKIGYLLRLTATLKLPVIREWIDNFLEGSDEKLTVYGIHRKIVESLHETYGKVSVLVHGGITGGNRQRAVDQFQRDKKTRLFIGNVKAAGVGLTLTAAATVANIEFGWVPGDHIQAEGRISRIGQTRSQTSYWIVGRDTIEERLVKVLQTKQQNIDAVVDGDDEVNQLDVYDQLIDELRKDSHEKRSRPTTKNPPKTRRR